MPLTITGFTAAALAILLVLLALDTIRNRFRARQPFGLGDDPALTSASRAHGNLAENAPIALILIALLEYSGAAREILTYAAAAARDRRDRDIGDPAWAGRMAAGAVAVTFPFLPREATRGTTKWWRGRLHERQSPAARAPPSACGRHLPR